MTVAWSFAQGLRLQEGGQCLSVVLLSFPLPRHGPRWNAVTGPQCPHLQTPCLRVAVILTGTACTDSLNVSRTLGTSLRFAVHRVDGDDDDDDVVVSLLLGGGGMVAVLAM